MLTPAQTSLLTDQYELAMASSYLRRRMNELEALPPCLRKLDGDGESYPVSYSDLCRAALQAVDARVR